MTWAGSRISLSRPKAASSHADSLRLGGTTLWSNGDFDLNEAVELLERQIIWCADSVVLIFTRGVLRKLVAESLGEDTLENRVFGAVLGRVAQRGLIDELLLVSRNDNPFRAYFSTRNWGRIYTSLDAANTLLKKHQRLQVRELESHLFNRRQYNTWSTASHFLARLAYLGTARQVDDMTFEYIDVAKLADA